MEPVGGEPWSLPSPGEPPAATTVPRPGEDSWGQAPGGSAVDEAPDVRRARASDASKDTGPHADGGSRTPSRPFRPFQETQPSWATSASASGSSLSPESAGSSGPLASDGSTGGAGPTESSPAGAPSASPSASAPSVTRTPEPPRAPAPHHEPAHPRVPGRRTAPTNPPPPPASARFPDAPPAARRSGVPDDGITETTGRLRSNPGGTTAEPPTPASPAPGTGRPYVSFAEPETNNGFTSFDSFDTYDPLDQATTRLRTVPVRAARTRPRLVATAACLVLGLGLIGGAVTGSWLTGDSAGADGALSSFAAAAGLWHSVPVDQLFPPTVDGQGAGPGGADRTWTRIAVAPDSDCANAFDPLLRQVLAPVGCLRLLRATYTDVTHSQITTVGLLFTNTDAAAMTSLKARFQQQGLDRRTDLMPRPYAVKGTVAAGFGDAQRASWTVSVLTDAPVVVYAVSGFADGRVVTAPQPAADAVRPGVTTAPAQAGLGNDAQGLADRVERSLRRTVGSASEKPS
ncbi:hypothetical protein ABZV34_25770 [Streptomyces sp. NPDC005195]|uniref:hypothetical protein n=1 Tax=Streptomyces sp. NPDC005195 TaxID=3154561 RepID=UPI0033A4F673